jgi:hypothetical protein
MKNTKVTNKNGYELDFDTAVNLMDEEIREQLHNNLAPCTTQEFFTTYEKAHEAKYGEEWELSKANPTW